MRKYKAIVERTVEMEVEFWANDDKDALQKCVYAYNNAIDNGVAKTANAWLVGMSPAYASNLKEQE